MNLHMIEQHPSLLGLCRLDVLVLLNGVCVAVAKIGRALGNLGSSLSVTDQGGY